MDKNANNANNANNSNNSSNKNANKNEHALISKFFLTIAAPFF